MRKLAPGALLLLLSGCGSTIPAQTLDSPSSTVVSTTASGDTPAGNIATVQTVADSRPATVSFRIPAVDVWEALLPALAALEIPVGTLDTRAFTVGNTHLIFSGRIAGKPASRFLNCGSGPFGEPLADSYRIRMGLLITLDPQEDGGTEMHTRTEAMAVNRTSGGNSVRCATNGRLENLIQQEVQKQLAAR